MTSGLARAAQTQKLVREMAVTLHTDLTVRMVGATAMTQVYELEARLFEFADALLMRERADRAEATVTGAFASV